MPTFSSADLKTSYASFHQTLTNFITHLHFPCPARRGSDSAYVLDVCLCRCMNPVHLTKFWERHATAQLKPEAVLEYLLQLFFFWLFMFLIHSGCSVVTINGTVMPLTCVLRTAHPMLWEAAHGKTAPLHASHKCHFPFYSFKHVWAPWIRSCQGMTCRQLVWKNFCVGTGPLISWNVSCETSGIMLYKTT